MAGKIAGLAPTPDGLKIQGQLLIYYSPFYKKHIARAWPKSNGGDTPRRTASRASFTALVKLIKGITTLEYQAAVDLTKNSPYLVRDVAMMAACGRLIKWTDTTGQAWTGVRTVPDNIQNLLDTITQQPGAMLVRAPGGWVAILPPIAESVMVFSALDGLPEWADPSSIAVAVSLPLVNGDVAPPGPIADDSGQLIAVTPHYDPIATATQIQDYLHIGAEAQRPIAPNIGDNSIAFYYGTDSGSLALFAVGNWHPINTLPRGGGANQVLTKASNTNYDSEWA